MLMIQLRALHRRLRILRAFMIQASRNRSQRQVISTTPRHRTAIVNSLVRPRMRRALGANSTQRAIGPILAQALRHLQVASEDAQSPVPRMIRNDTQVAVPIDPLTREETNGLIRITNDILQLVQEGAQLERNRATAPEARHVPTANPVQPAQAEPPPRAQRPRRRMERRKRRDKAGQKRRQRTQTWVATFVQGLVALAAIIRDAARPLTESVGKLCKTGLELIVRGVDKVILRDDYKILFGNVSKIQASRVFKTLLVAGAGGIVYVKWDDLSHGLLTAPDTVRRAFERHELRSRPIYESTGTIDPEPASLFEAVAAEAMSTSATSDPEVTDILDMLFPRGIWVPRDEASAALRQSLLVKSREEYLTTHEMRDYLVSTLFASQPLARSHTDALLATPGEVVPQQVVRDLEEFDWDMWPKSK